jgi:uncharacterized membrane protein HdeD (DUF308 family)
MFAFGPPLSRGRAAAGGAVAAALGVASLAWPGITIGAAVALFAIYCFADAITQFVSFFRSDESTGRHVLMILLGLLDVTAGVVAIAYPGITAGALVIVIGLWAIVGGSIELASAWGIAGPGAGWLTVGGILSIIAGVLLIAWPGVGAFTLAIVFGVYLLTYGLTMLVSAAASPRGREVGETVG